MFITLPRNFGAGSLRKRARPAPRRKNIDALQQIAAEVEQAIAVGDVAQLQKLARIAVALAQLGA